MVELLDLIEEDVLKEMQKRFSELFGFNVAFTGLNSRSVGYPDISGEDRYYIKGTTCELIAKNNPEGSRCYESDVEAGKHAMKLKKPLLYKCQSLCSNFVIPINVGDDIIGFIYSGQFFVFPPGEKTELEWEALRVKMNISPSEWPAKKREIIQQEKKEFGEFLKEGYAENLDRNKELIRANFFQSLKNPPKDEDLEAIAEENSLMHMKEDFVRVFKDKSAPHHPNNRVKDFKEIIKDIKILRTIANALSEECNAKYALKTYFEACEEAKETFNSVSLFYRGAKKEIYRDLEDLSKEIVPFVRKSEEQSQERMALMDKIDGIAGSIYEKILRVEASRTLWCARGINVLCFKKVSKEPIKKWLGSPHGGIDVSKKPARKWKERLKLEIKDLRECKKKTQEMSSDRYAIGISIWVGAVLSLAIGLFFGLKQMGVI
jgi:ligand-binding sensor protein